MSQYFSFALTFSFSLFVACTCVFFVSGAYLLFFKIQKTNRLFKHPYLANQNFNQYPFNIRMAIVLDYFLRLAFPNSKVWLAGHANRLLAHIDPIDVPTDIKWPILGLWGSCLLGMVSMVTLWILLMNGGSQ